MIFCPFFQFFAIFAHFAHFAHPHRPPHGLGSSFLGTSWCVKYSCIDFKWDIENFFLFFSLFFAHFCPFSQFLPFLHILRILRTPMGHTMASVHHVWVQAGVWSIVALISGEIARTFSFFFIIFKRSMAGHFDKKGHFWGWGGGGGGRPQGLR